MIAASRWLIFPVLLPVLAGFSPGVEVVTSTEPFLDRWNYENNATPGYRPKGSLFTGLPEDFDGGADRLAQIVLGFDTAAGGVPTGLDPWDYRVTGLTVTARVANDPQSLGDPELIHDPTPDPFPAVLPGGVDDDAGHPVELHGVGFRNGFTAATYVEGSPPAGIGQPGTPGTPYSGPEGQTAYALGFDPLGVARDVTNNPSEGFASRPWSVGTTAAAAPGDPIPVDTVLEFVVDLDQWGVRRYVQEALAAGRLMVTLSSLQVASFSGGSSGGGEFALFYMKESFEHEFFGDSAATVRLEVEAVPTAEVEEAVVAAAGVPVVRWPGEAGERFTVFGTTDLWNWTVLAEIEAATGGPQELVLPAGGTRFIEVRKRLD